MLSFNKMLGLFLGYLSGGPIGAAIGLLLGHLFDENFNYTKQEKEDINEATKTLYRPDQLNQAYRILGLNAESSTEEIKQAYRRGMGRYHPDRLAQQGLSKLELKRCLERSHAFKKAYETICTIKNIH